MADSEEIAVREEMASDPARYHDLADFLTLAINTGMRACEIVNLRLSEVDFDRKEVVLPAGRTKEAKAKPIPLNPAALQALERARADRRPEGRVFPPEFKYQRAATLWREVCKAAEVQNLRIHDLRHTFASRLLAAGVAETISVGSSATPRSR